MRDSFQERMGAGVVERARLESVCTSKGYRGFESLPIRHLSFCLAQISTTAGWQGFQGLNSKTVEEIFCARSIVNLSCLYLPPNSMAYFLLLISVKQWFLKLISLYET